MKGDSESQITPPIDIWKVAEDLRYAEEERLGLPHSSGPLGAGNEWKVPPFKSFDDLYVAWKQAELPITLVEAFLNDAYGVTGLFRDRIITDNE